MRRGRGPYVEILNGDRPEEIDGLIFRDKNGNIIDNGRSESVKDLDDIPFPARDLLPMDTYIRYNTGGEASEDGSKSNRYACVITSRQCPFSCTFCSSHPVFGRGWRGRSAENVLQEIEELYRLYKITHIQFLEDNFSFNRERLIRILDGLIAFNKKIDRPISYNASGATRVDSLDEEIIVKMRDANFVSLSLPVEHGDQKLNDIMKKNLDLEKVKKVVGWAKKYNIVTHINVLVGHYAEDDNIFRNSLNYFLELKKLVLPIFIPLF